MNGDLDDIDLPEIDDSFTNDKRTMFPQSNLTVSDVCMILEAINVSFGATRAHHTAMLELIKLLAGPQFTTWNFSSYLLSERVGTPKEHLKKVYYCTECNVTLGEILLSDIKKRTFRCEKCEKSFRITCQSENYFITLDIKYQLQKLLARKNIERSIIEYYRNTEKKKEDENVIRDISDCELFKQKIKDPFAVSLNFSLDGAQLFNSANKALWPFQAHLNCLTEKVRLKHPIIIALWQTEKEPKPPLLGLIISQLIKQRNVINNEGGIDIIDGKTGTLTKKPLSIYCGCLDSVAQPIAQFRTQFNGYYGCSYCYHLGEYSDGSMRYPMLPEDPEIRTHESHLQDIENLKLKKNNKRKMTKKEINYRGVKGEAYLLQIEGFDIVWMLPIDQLHTAFLGAAKQDWKFTKDLLSKNDLAKITKRMSHIRLSKDFRRSLRPLCYAARYKALEWKLWLLFVSVPCLHGILDEKIFSSYLLLVNSIFTLLRDTITIEEINYSEYNLVKFVSMSEIHFGKKFMTFNIHLLLHFCESVRKAGPLWATSTFPFESSIGTFLKQINAPNGCTKQIATKWMKKCTFENYVENNKSNSRSAVDLCKSILNSKPVVESHIKFDDVSLFGKGEENEEIQNYMRKKYNNCNLQVLVFDRCTFKSQFYHSVHYSRIIKTDDTVVKLNDGKILQIQGIIKADRVYVCGFEWEVDLNDFGTDDFNRPAVQHIFKVVKKNDILIIQSFHNIQKKMMVLDTGEKVYITYLPNNFESH